MKPVEIPQKYTMLQNSETSKIRKMKCYLFNDPFDNYGHPGSGKGSGELRSGVGPEQNDEG